ncbi:hypothetical protein Francci3_2932 [Frankia casuarinae]|uniref:Uncharacterized protein n=1 Tax=Frankia casuarinae (strain DSM 45818 / CECT 9043 / HFP020203 / CcI3) TaxID=106370 RepID=Q2J8V2_FRACC|nr:hypothetical protein Francci3_2932 [Frankia casuarinae]
MFGRLFLRNNRTSMTLVPGCPRGSDTSKLSPGLAVRCHGHEDLRQCFGTTLFRDNVVPEQPAGRLALRRTGRSAPVNRFPIPHT